MDITARHQAWLVRPLKSTKGKKCPLDLAKKMPKSTAQQLPPLLGFEYLAAAWSEAGRFAHGAHGIIPLPWSELAAYQQLVAPSLNGFELSLIRAMSESFCDEMNAGEDRPQPYIVGQPVKTTAERLADAAANREKASFCAR